MLSSQSIRYLEIPEDEAMFQQDNDGSLLKTEWGTEVQTEGLGFSL
jgi:hypothetical protein